MIPHYNHRTVLTVLVLLCTTLVAFSGSRRVRIKSRYINIPTDTIAADTVRTVPTDTMDVYSGHRVSTEVTIYSTSTLRIDSIIVANGGGLCATAEDSIVVSSDMEVELGGSLRLNGPSQYAVSYTYDAAGYRNARRLSSNNN